MRRLLLAFVLGVVSLDANAAPYPNPTTATQLACNMSPTHNPTDYRDWWTHVANGVGDYQHWFWTWIMVNQSVSACRVETAQTFWHQAVPQDWNQVANIGGWYTTPSGYFRQTLWLRAIPERWSPIADIGGWDESTGGYYEQTFWLRAVPENWASVPGIPTWHQSSDGYYKQWLWASAIPNEWASVPNIGGWHQSTGGYYTQMFWLRAVPNNIKMIDNIGNWPWSSGGYYTQWFWLHAVPDDWAPGREEMGHVFYQIRGSLQGYYRKIFWERAVPEGWKPKYQTIPGGPSNSNGYYSYHFWQSAVRNQWARRAEYSINGVSNRGYYDFWFYHYAVPRGFAWNPWYIVNGRWGGGYYEYWHYTHFGQTQSHFISRLATARSYVDVAESAPEDRVDLWFHPDAQAVVILTFDTEGSENDTKTVHDILQPLGIPATFYMVGDTLRRVQASTTWQTYLESFDLQNHTNVHPGNGDYAFPQGNDALLNTFPTTRIRSEIDTCNTELASTFSTFGTSFRVPWCDGHKSFDMGIARALMDAGMTSDSSVTTIANVAASNNWVPPAGMRNMSLHNHPFPFLIQDGSRSLIEFPFSYPSDWQAPTRPTNLTMGRPPNTTDRTYLMNAWLAILDEIRTRRGVMVVLMHPSTQAHANNGNGDGLAYLVEQMGSRTGVRFSTISEATERYRAYRGLP